MLTPIARLEERVNRFGNHHRKYLYFIQKKHAELIDRLESKGLIEQIHLWNAAGTRFAKEMQLIESIGETKKEKLDFMGWFYSTQFLLMNIRAIDVLSLNLSQEIDRFAVYRQFMKKIGLEFRNLTAVYMENLLNLFIPAAQKPEFAILGVGTRADQDDIDLGIIDDGSQQREVLNPAIGQLQGEMLKHASRLHLYLSEYIGTKSYSASISEYNQLLQAEIHDFIVISEMLGAALIMGSRRLFKEFQKVITHRFYYQPDQTNKFHEGYLRGILGEIRSLLGKRVQAEFVHPKDDALRIIKALAYAGKSICGIPQVNAWEILEMLSICQPARRSHYRHLEQALSFFEVFRFLYQLYVVQEEEIYFVDQEDVQRLEMVARLMGYRKIGAKNASDFLLVEYYEQQEYVRQIANDFLEDFKEHLKSVTVFSSLFQPGKTPDSSNMLYQFFQKGNFFRGTEYWDDIFELLARNEGAGITKLVQSLQGLEPEKLQVYCRTLALAARNSFYSLITLLVLLSRFKHKPGFLQLFKMLNEEFLRVFVGERDRTLRVARLYNYNPRLINNYIMALDETRQKQFINLLEAGELYNKEDIVVKDKLKNLGELYFTNSRYFRRYFLTVINKYPKFIQYVDDIERLRKIAEGFLGSIENYNSFKEKKAILKDNFYVNFFRVGLATIQGNSLQYVESEYTMFFFSFLQELFNVCKLEIETELGKQVMTHDLMAIYVAGSLGREHAFDDDLDLIVVLNSDDAEIRECCSKIIMRMNREIVRQAILPHYRFAEHFGNYVTILSQLEGWLAQCSENCFIEKSQILGARMIVGSSRFEKKFANRVIKPFIHDEKEQFILAMIDEMKSRHEIIRATPEAQLNIKEAVGGLRDIEMVLLIYKALYGINEPVNVRIIEYLQANYPQLTPQMQKLTEAFDFLRYLRNVYRIVVTAKNTIAPDYLERPAQIMGIATKPGESAATQLLNKYHEMCQQSNQVVEQLLERILTKIN